ncbi:MAG: hypothetical protein M5U34_43885 [Chloroflexi bacterium]|nr:hypothetical protein [Chloroflexota bacterium]
MRSVHCAGAADDHDDPSEVYDIEPGFLAPSFEQFTDIGFFVIGGDAQ